MTTGIDTTTFKSARVMGAGSLYEAAVPNLSKMLDGLATSPSPALQAASAAFVKQAEERSTPTTGDVNTRLTAIRKRIAGSRGVHSDLGENGLGIESMPRQAVVINILDADKMAAAVNKAVGEYGAPSVVLADTSPTRPLTPALAKISDKQIS